ncbi:hypothetical protein [Coleofasciculus sp. E1-EBD-02]|uniref:hypothetical protein n=1 Tax=Coleofasciculus sp. E1-EBD-02 TaxID=3068481 RepID=UPI003300A88A
MKLASPNLRRHKSRLEHPFSIFHAQLVCTMPDSFLGILLSFTLNIRSRLECPPRKPDAFFVLIVSRSPMNYT